MGIYINPKNMEKEEWLDRNGVYQTNRPKTHINDKDEIAVCLVQNPGFTAAAICYSQRELEAFQYPDHRHKDWYYVPIQSLIDADMIRREDIKEKTNA